MGYGFAFEKQSVRNGHSSMSGGQRAIMVEVMRPVGAIRQQGCDPDFTLLPDGVRQARFRCNDNHHVTPAQCLLIAAQLRAGLENGAATELLCVFDDAPSGKEARGWIEAWADDNERAAPAGG